ncbi:MAG: dihydrofolate reductase family protein, partial [Gemmatimonadaceae bacterium]
AAWANTTVVKGDLAANVRKLKKTAGKPLMIFGSGTIIAQLTDKGLIDEYRLAQNPVVLGQGRTMFEGVPGKMNFERTRTQSFSNGNIVTWYKPAE